jgi:hypothetical protein
MNPCCTNCKRQFPLSHFRPADVEQEARKRILFDDALDAFLKENNESTRLAVEKARKASCTSCREIVKKSARNPNTIMGKCYWTAIALRTGDCSVCGKCTDKLEYDHRLDEEKVYEVLAAAYWACHGGVDAMIKETNKCNPKCHDCHSDYEAEGKINHAIHKRKYATLEEMPTTTTAEKQAKRVRGYRDEKQTYVNDIKMRIGGCQECSKRISGREHCFKFEFAHRDATDYKGKVANIVNSRTTLKTAKPLLDKEIAKCRLLCHDCHREETRSRNK